MCGESSFLKVYIFKTKTNKTKQKLNLGWKEFRVLRTGSYVSDTSIIRVADVIPPGFPALGLYSDFAML